MRKCFEILRPGWVARLKFAIIASDAPYSLIRYKIEGVEEC